MEVQNTTVQWNQIEETLLATLDDLRDIYGYVNEAWNSRHDKSFISEPEEARRRRLFPREVLGGDTTYHM